MAFQMMFAVITPALITGAFAERKKFKAFVLFSLLWTLLVYSPIAHWVWGQGGWLAKLGAIDFAGGTVVHISSGVAALVAALVLGPRVKRESERFEPHDVRLAVLGAGLLWFGWFGFNGGSASASNGLAANAFVVTNTAAGMGALTWVTVSWLHKGTPSVVGAAAGARRRSGGDHAGLRLRGRERGDHHRLRGRVGLLRRDPAARAAQGRRRARRLGRPRRRRHARRDPHRRLRDRGGQRRLRGPDRRQRRPGRQAARCRGRHVDLQRRCHLHHPQGRRPLRRASASRSPRRKPASTPRSTARWPGSPRSRDRRAHIADPALSPPARPVRQPEPR